MNDEARQLLEKALDLFHGTHELCDDVGSDEWIWRWRVLTLLDDAASPEFAAPEQGAMEY